MADHRNTIAAAAEAQAQALAQAEARAADQERRAEAAESRLATLKANLAKASDLVGVKVFETDPNSGARPRPVRMTEGYVLRAAIVGATDALCTLDLDSFSGDYDTAVKLFLVGGSEIFADIGEDQSAETFLATLAPRGGTK